MPKVKFFDILNGSGVKNSPVQETRLRNETIISSRRNPEKDLVLILQTDRGQATARIPGQSSGFNKDLPVGTIISSYLNFQQFGEVTKNNEANPDKVNIWTAKFSKWAPCNGRDVRDSKFGPFSANGMSPDLRGQFMRGLNVLDASPHPSVPALSDARRDPQADRQSGGFQTDAFKAHKHGVRDLGHTHSYREPGGGGSSGVPGNPQGLTSATTGGGNANIQMDNEGGDETRPKNVAVYYYIRVN